MTGVGGGIVCLYLCHMNSYLDIDLIASRIAAQLGVPQAELHWMGGGKIRYPHAVFSFSGIEKPWLEMWECPAEQRPAWEPQIQVLRNVLEFYRIPLVIPDDFMLYSSNSNLLMLRFEGRSFVFYL